MSVTDFEVATSAQSSVRVPRGELDSHRQAMSWQKKVLILAYLVVVCGFLYFMIRGYSYYTTPFSLRPHHPDYRLFRPAGHFGLRFGIVGTALLVALLFYSIRKRTRFFAKKGRLKNWLNAHIFCGVAGPLFILLHTSFKLNGLVSVSFWSMVAVALSGVFGRYLYQQIPRNIRGKALTFKELEDQDLLLNQELENTYGSSEVRRTWWFRPKLNEQPSLFGILKEDVVAPFQWARYRRFLATKSQLKPHETEAIFTSAKQKWTLEKRLRRLRKIERVFHLWHVIHLPFATIMYAIMFIHIIIALLFGIAWEGQG